MRRFRWLALILLLCAGCRPGGPPAQPPPPPADAPIPPPEPVGRPLRFIVYGDCRSNPDIHRRVVERMLTVEPRPALVFQTGDLVGDGKDEALWTQALDIIAPLREFADYYPAMGNHDRGVRDLQAKFDLPAEPPVTWYTFARDDCRFIVLDTNTIRHPGDEAQIGWLTETLAEATEPHVFVFQHHPAYSIGDYAPGDPGVEARLHPVLEQSFVTAVFCGHDHGYYRTERDGVRYLLTAGGGAPLYDQDASLAQPGDVFAKVHHFVVVDVAGRSVTAEAIDLDGNVIDRVDLSEPMP